jgi:hypothetical protein
MAKAAAKSPDGLRLFEQLMRQAGHPVQLIWLDKGPTGMPIKLHALYRLGDSIVYVQGFLNGTWRAYTHDREDNPASVSDVIARAAPRSARVGRRR